MELKEMERLGIIDDQIQRLKRAALKLRDMSEGLPALDCNTRRILAGVKMLEINFCDIKGIIDVEGKSGPA